MAYSGTISEEDSNDSISDKPDESTLSKYVELRDQLINIYNGTPAVDLVNAETTAAVEEDAGVVNLEKGEKELKADKLKKLVENTLQTVYQDLTKAIGNLPEEQGEKAKLIKIYNTVKGKIEGLTEFKDAEIRRKFVDGKATDTVITSDKKLKTYIHTLLEAEYGDEIRFDSPIEAAWTALAFKDTGLDNKWY
jgi:uncharacterized protein YfbU (UPF0304 family)